jgi:hypothetical protein
MSCGTCGKNCTCTPASAKPPAESCCANPKCDGVACKAPSGPARLTMRQARAEVAKTTAEFLEGVAKGCLEDGARAPRGSTAKANATLLALAARELAAGAVTAAAKLDGPLVVSPDRGLRVVQ